MDLRNWIRQHKAVTGVAGGLLLLGLAGSCGADPEPAPTGGAKAPKAAASDTPPKTEPSEEPTSTRSEDCLSVPSPLVRAIVIDGREKNIGDVRVDGEAWAVKSGDFKNLYFIAAPFRLTGVDEPQVGLWASNSLKNGGGMVIAVDGFAQEFTVWPDGDKTSADITKADDGADEALRCVTD